MELPAIVASLALLEYTFFTYRVGMTREKYGVPAPATSGHPEWERLWRVQQNTLEQLAIFLPALYLFSIYVDPVIGAAIGLVFVIARWLYYVRYVQDPATRGTPFVAGVLASGVLLLGGLVGAVASLL